MQLQLLTVSSLQMTKMQLDAVISLCSKVFEVDYAYYMNLPYKRMHVLGYLDGELVSHALWLERKLYIADGAWCQAAYVEGVATNARYRRRGHGSSLMRKLQQEISEYDLGALSPRVPEWYERLGWLRWQGPLQISKDKETFATPGECVLVYRTPRTGAIDTTRTLTAEWRPFELW